MAYNQRQGKSDKINPYFSMGSIIAVHAGKLMLKTIEMNFEEPMQVMNWGNGVEVLESAMYPFLINDKKYFSDRAKIKKMVQSIPMPSNNMKDTQRYFQIYNQWFRMLCHKMTMFNLYPEIKGEYDIADNIMEDMGDFNGFDKSIPNE